MQVHANAKLVPSSRLLLVRRVLDEGWNVADAAAMGVSERGKIRIGGSLAGGAVIDFWLTARRLPSVCHGARL